MADSERAPLPLPEDFVSEEEAAEFWDSHSLADYEEYLEAVDVEVDLKRRDFEIRTASGQLADARREL